MPQLPPELQNYPGNKHTEGQYQRIINLQPPHEVYISGCLGSGADILNKRPATLNYGVDIDENIIRAWRTLGLTGIELIQGDIMLCLTSWEAYGKRALLYLDFPYPMPSRKSQRPLYKYEMTMDQHEAALTLLVNSPNMVQIQTYPNDLYSKCLKDWNYKDYKAMTRGGVATERIYFNYDWPTELHDYRYFGQNWRDRDNIKRQLKGWRKRLETFDPEQKANAIIRQRQLLDVLSTEVSSRNNSDVTGVSDHPTE